MTPLPPTDRLDRTAASIGETGSDMATPDGRPTSAAPATPADQGSRHTMHGAHRGALITVTAHPNARGAWIADVSISREGRPMPIPAELAHAEPIVPEWLTEAEALRAGIEHGRYLIDRTLGDPFSPQSQQRLDEQR